MFSNDSSVLMFTVIMYVDVLLPGRFSKDSLVLMRKCVPLLRYPQPTFVHVLKPEFSLFSHL